MGRYERKKISLLLASDKQIIQAGLVSLLAGDVEIELIGQTTNISATIRLIGEREPDVVLIDPTMPDQDGWRAIELIRGEWPTVAILVFTHQWHQDTLLRMLRVGIHAYLTARTERATFLHAIHTAVRGDTLLQPEQIRHLLSLIDVSPDRPEVPVTNADMKSVITDLTEREREILQWVARGDRNKEIAARLKISEPTVKSHLASAYYKLGVDSRASAVAAALERAILPLVGQSSRQIISSISVRPAAT